MAKNQKPLFAAMLTDAGAAETEPQVQEKITKQTPAGEETATEEKPVRQGKTKNVPKQKDTEKPEREPQLYIKGEPVKAVLVHMPIGQFEKICAISAFENMTKKAVINQAVSHCIAIYEQKNANFQTRRNTAAKNIFD